MLACLLMLLPFSALKLTNLVPILQDVKTTEPSVTLATDALTFVLSGPCSHSLQQALPRKQLHYFH